MSQLTINVGTIANDKTGDTLRAAFVKANSNFTELYTASGTVPNGTKTSTAVGTAGQISYDSTYLYVCIATNTWRRVALGSTY
jgi:hypothetical protein